MSNSKRKITITNIQVQEKKRAIIDVKIKEKDEMKDEVKDAKIILDFRAKLATVTGGDSYIIADYLSEHYNEIYQ